jgi:hypothetical protein
MPSALFLWGEYPDTLVENKWRLITQYRNELLSRCDWTQLPDAVLTLDEKILWQDYRQLLRDIPQDYLNPDDVVFPTSPNEVTNA